MRPPPPKKMKTNGYTSSVCGHEDDLMLQLPDDPNLIRPHYIGHSPKLRLKLFMPTIFRANDFM